MEERIKATNREIQNLLNLVKAGGESQQAVEEIKRLENSKREMEAKSIEIDAQIAQRKRAVYDIDAIQGALHRFARFIYKIPIQLQIYALRILIKRVTITRDKIGVELHELPVGALQLALDERCWTKPKGVAKTGSPIENFGMVWTPPLKCGIIVPTSHLKCGYQHEKEEL